MDNPKGESPMKNLILAAGIAFANSEQLPMQDSRPCHGQVRFRIDVIAHGFGETCQLDALGWRQRSLYFLVNKRKPPLIQRIVPCSINGARFNDDLAEQFCGRFNIHAGVAERLENGPSGRHPQFRNAGVGWKPSMGVEEMHFKMFDELPNPIVGAFRDQFPG
jgi:hypothetical protein